LYPALLGSTSLLLASIVGSALLGGYLLARCEPSLKLASIMVCLIAILVVLFTRMMHNTSLTEAQRSLYAALSAVGCALAAFSGAVFTSVALRRGASARVVAAVASAIALATAAEAAAEMGWLATGLVAPISVFAPGLIALLAILRRELFPEIEKSALESSVHDLGDPIAVFDLRGRLVDSGTTKLAGVLPLSGSPTIEAFIECVGAQVEAGRFFRGTEIEGLTPGSPGREIALRGSDGHCWYIAYANHVVDARGKRLGTVFSFYDVSLLKRLEAELAEGNVRFASANAELRDYLAIADRLEEERERRFVLDGVHRSLGPTLDDLRVALISALARIEEGDPQPFLDGLIAQSRGIMGTIRAAVSRLMPSGRRVEEGGGR
jgi:PAS domain-containing protein